VIDAEPAERTSRTAIREPRAIAALALGALSLVLIWPFGVFLGPVGLWFGISALRRITGSGGHRVGLGPAVAGVTMSGVVCACYGLALAAEIASVLLTGGPIPAY
jgi:hypothetical protein